MPPASTTVSRRLLAAVVGSLLLAVASCASPPPTASVAIPPIPAGEARVWFYRDEGPYESRVRPGVRMNDAMVGEVEPRGAFYRDTAPGRYRVAVDSYVPNPNAARDINLDPGEQVYFKIVSEGVDQRRRCFTTGLSAMADAGRVGTG